MSLRTNWLYLWYSDSIILSHVYVLLTPTCIWCFIVRWCFITHWCFIFMYDKSETTWIKKNNFNKTNVDRTFVFPLGWNWHDMDPWLFPNEIRHYLGQTFNARSSGIVELRNHSIGGRSPKSIFTLWQLWIYICIFFQKFFWLSNPYGY